MNGYLKEGCSHNAQCAYSEREPQDCLLGEMRLWRKRINE